jgi:alkylation response protein AidB-like acyl-CoA dehydrogenase
MDLDFTADQEAFRAEARAWLHAHVPAAAAPLPGDRGGLRRAPRLGGRTRRGPLVGGVLAGGVRRPGRGLVRWLVFEEEYYAAGAPGRVGQNGINLLAPTLFDHGTRGATRAVLPPMATGEVVWAQAWSEPEAGSDLASLTSGRCARTGAGC